MLREDKEKVGAYDPAALSGLRCEDWISEPAGEIARVKRAAVLRTLTSFSPQRVRFASLNDAANARFERGVRQLSSARAIVTDRLHVHIVSLLLGRPHAVLDNSYGKIAKFMAAFSGDNDLSYRANSLADAIEWARSQAVTQEFR
jgi:exopolysaccharide biosynthesis predicted pyruvyltransferase EpsI